MEKLISFDLKADLGMLKKPDTNEPVYLTFNMLHKPALLGILGAIIGLKGFQENGKLPEYYEVLKQVRVGIMPLPTDENDEKNYHEKGNFTKTIIKYNNSTGLASEEAGGNLIVTEQTLVTPAFRCFVVLDENIEEQNKLIENLLSYQAEFVPYLGKNDCSLWWENAGNINYTEFIPDGAFKINSLFIKEEAVINGIKKLRYIPGQIRSLENLPFLYFENLPVSYLGKPLFQYEYKPFAYTNYELKEDYTLPTSLPLIKTVKNEILQLF